MIRHHHATAPGTVEYAPVVHRNVPKYFTPAGAPERLIPKPRAPVRRLVRMNGQRSLSLSEQWPKINKVAAGRGPSLGRWVRDVELDGRTCDSKWWNSEKVCDGNRVSKSSDDRGQEESDPIN